MIALASVADPICLPGDGEPSYGAANGTAPTVSLSPAGMGAVPLLVRPANQPRRGSGLAVLALAPTRHNSRRHALIPLRDPAIVRPLVHF
jgi:hypothetical protein